MSTNEAFLAEVLQHMKSKEALQNLVAATCGVSQGHMSKVLNKKVKLTKKLRARLSAWMVAEQAQPDEELQAIIGRLVDAPPEKHMQIMQILRAIDNIAR